MITILIIILRLQFKTTPAQASWHLLPKFGLLALMSMSEASSTLKPETSKNQHFNWVTRASSVKDVFVYNSYTLRASCILPCWNYIVQQQHFIMISKTWSCDGGSIIDQYCEKNPFSYALVRKQTFLPNTWTNQFWFLPGFFFENASATISGAGSARANAVYLLLYPTLCFTDSPRNIVQLFGIFQNIIQLLASLTAKEISSKCNTKSYIVKENEM